MNLEDSETGQRLLPEVEKLCASNDWFYVRFLGAGASAAVYEIQTAQGPRALKFFSPEFLVGARGVLVKRRFDLVLEKLSGHGCPSLIKIDGGGHTETSIYLVMQLAPGDCLGEVLKLVPPSEVRNIIRQVARAAIFLEEKNLCHRDIKSDNIVVSKDFKTATLLDLGVVRWMDDVGSVGSDDEGKLPFVATARYSSPEYMFRLYPADRNMWRGLTFYQLGGVLHDLIMGEKLFEEVVSRASENRYLIAYAVATQVPKIQHDGSVPLDLVLLAQRSLEKSVAKRLASVDWEDFLNDAPERQDEVILGLRSGSSPVQAPSKSRVPEWAKGLDDALDRKLIEAGIHLQHLPYTLSANSAEVRMSWSPRNTVLPTNSLIKITIHLATVGESLEVTASGQLFIEESLIASLEAVPVTALPSVYDEQPESLVHHAHRAFIKISAALVKNYSSGE